MRRRLLRPAVPAMRARLRRERPVPHSRPPPLDTPARARACSSGRTKGLAAATMDRSEMAGASASKATRATGGSQWHSSNSRAHRCRFDWVGLAVPQRTLLASMASMLGNGFRYRSGGQTVVLFVVRALPFVRSTCHHAKGLACNRDCANGTVPWRLCIWDCRCQHCATGYWNCGGACFDAKCDGMYCGSDTNARPDQVSDVSHAWYPTRHGTTLRAVLAGRP